MLRLAVREARATRRRLLLLTSAVTAGVAALVAINSFTDNLQRSVQGQAQALMGADLSLTARQPLSARAAALADTLACGGGRPPCREGAIARLTTFSAMAYVPRTLGTRLVQVSAVDGGYPFYGEIRTAPAAAWSTLQQGRRVLVDPSLLTALNAGVGDSLSLGETRFAISGTVLSAPGDVGIRSAFGPRIFIPGRYLPDTRLLTFGARAEYETLVRLPHGADPERLAARVRPAFRAEQVRIRTVADDRQSLSDALTRLGRYLGLVALVALLLGGLGVASAVHVLVRQKQPTIAVLRCRGATSGKIFAVYLVQAAGIGLVGSIAGAALGALVQLLLPAVLHDFLPVDVAVTPSVPAIALGLLTGVWTAVAFALLPLLAVRRVPPLAALRRDYETVAAPPDRWRWPAAAVVALSVVLLAALQVGNWRSGVIFAAGIGAALGALRLAAELLVRAVRRWTPAGWPYVWRQGLANLHRPGNQTVTVVLSIGFGAFLLSILLLMQHTLLRQLDVAGGPARPNLVLFDIQPEQHAGVDSVVRAAGLPVGGATPIVPMRILSIKGRPVTQLLADSGGGSRRAGSRRGGRGEASNGWALRREYRSTYRDTVVASERLVAGRWWTGPSADSLVDISVEQGLARELGAIVGDEIIWDVQGVPVVSRITSLREVDWARFEPNFFVVFRAGILDGAPQTLVSLTRVADAGARGRLQRRLAERFANVTTVDLSSVQQAVERLVDRVVLAIRFMALFSLATGAVVLVGAVATSRYQRLREGALLKTLGATRGQVLRVVVAEYMALGLLAAVVAIGLATLAGWGIAHWVFDAPFALPALPIALLALFVAGGTAAVGALNSLDVVFRTPLAVLRAE